MNTLPLRAPADVPADSDSDSEPQPLAKRRKIVCFLMSWLYVSAGLCLLPMAAVLAVFVLLGFIPQAQEVLYALTETGRGGQANLWRLFFIFFAQLSLAMIIWYSARLLCTVDADYAVPSYLRRPESTPFLQKAVTWAPRLLGFLAAAALSSVLILAAAQAVAIHPLYYLAVMLALGPLLIKLNKFFPDRKVLTFSLAAFLVVLGGVIVFGSDMRIGLFLMLETLFPPLLLLALDNRRAWLRKLRLLQAPTAAGAPHRLSEMRDRVLIMAASGVIGAVGLTLLPERFASLMGPAAVVLLTISLVVLVLAPLTMGMRRLFRFTPGWPILVTFLVVAWLVWQGRPQYGKESLKVELPSVAAPPAPSSAPQHYFAVNAHGGGLRAALFTGLVLARLDDMTCGRFGQGLVAASAVSGGSLGVAMYLSLRQDFVARGGWACTNPTDTPLQNLVADALGRDHLSPVVARLAFRDVFVPRLDAARGQALLGSWQEGAVASFGDRPADKKAPVVGLARYLAELHGGLARPPLVYFNTTDGLTGEKAWFSNDKAEQFHHATVTDAAARATVTVGEAVLHSARFPLVSPPGHFADKAYAFVDGGYVDNSGAGTLLTVLEDKLQGVDMTRLHVLNIDGNPPPRDTCALDVSKSKDLGIEVSALLKVRSANARAAVEALKDAYPKKVVDITYNLKEAFRQSSPEGMKEEALCDIVNRQRHAPLGWFISQAAQAAMNVSALSGANKVCATVGGFCANPALVTARR